MSPGQRLLCTSLPLFLAITLIAHPAVSRTQDEAKGKRVDQLFVAFDKADSPGCALGVIRDGEFIYKRGYGLASLEFGVGINSRTVFYVGSVSKQFVAASVTLASQQGHLGLNNDIRVYLPEIRNYGSPITSPPPAPPHERHPRLPDPDVLGRSPGAERLRGGRMCSPSSPVNKNLTSSRVPSISTATLATSCLPRSSGARRREVAPRVC